MPVTLTKATLWSLTYDEDRDHDTGLYVIVTKPDRTTILAYMYNGEASGEYGYADNTENTADLKISDPPPTKDDCQDYCFRVGIQANSGTFPSGSISVGIDGVNIGLITTGNDKWRFGCEMRLQFSDGSTLPPKRVNGWQLESRGSVLTWADWICESHL